MVDMMFTVLVNIMLDRHFSGCVRSKEGFLLKSFGGCSLAEEDFREEVENYETKLQTDRRFHAENKLKMIEAMWSHFKF